MDKLISFLMIIYIMVGIWISLTVIDKKIFNKSKEKASKFTVEI